MRSLALACLLLGACDEGEGAGDTDADSDVDTDADSDTGSGSGTDSDSGSDTGTDDFCTRWEDGSREAAERCCDDTALTPEEIDGWATGLGNLCREYHDPDSYSFTFDPDLEATCLAQHEPMWADCQMPYRDRWEDDPCLAPIGTAGLGELCEFSILECAEGLACQQLHDRSSCVEEAGADEVCGDGGYYLLYPCIETHRCVDDVCVPRAAEGEPCTSQRACAEGLLCDSGTDTCQPLVADGEACTSHYDCASGQCVAAICGREPYDVCGCIRGGC